MLTRLFALISTPIGEFVALGYAVALSALLILLIDNHRLSVRLDTANRSIGQLQGAVTFQNAAISQQGAETKVRLAAGQKLVLEAVAGRAPLEAEIARLRAVPAPGPSDDVCKAADALILGSLPDAP